MKFPSAAFFLLSILPVQCFAAAMPLNQPQTQPAPKIAEIRDIKGIIVQPGIDPQWYWIGGGILLALLLGGLFLYLKKIRNQKEQSLQAHEKALNALESARRLMTEQQSRQFAIRMADILRQYIEERFHLALQNLTTREFLSTLTKNPDIMQSDLHHHDQMLRDWLNHCDLVKFARYRLTEKEMEEMYKSIADFIASTRISGDKK